jgi:hypothetical protein
LHKIEFSFLNGSLMVPAGHLLNFMMIATLDLASRATA